MEMDDQSHAPAALPSGKKPGTPCKGIEFVSRPVRTVAESLAPTGIWFRGVQPVPITYLLTPWSKVILEKLAGLQLVKKFPAFYGTRSSLPHWHVPATCPRTKVSVQVRGK